jgi:hypothetical protein
VRRLETPHFFRHRMMGNAMSSRTYEYTPHGAPLTSDESARAHRLRMEGDRRFKLAMLDARRRGASETRSIVLGTVKAPATRRPRFMPHLPPPSSPGTSPAALCAELGGRGGTDW